MPHRLRRDLAITGKIAVAPNTLAESSSND
jgi:hypothetical protein